MRWRTAVPLLSTLLFAATGCDLVSDVDGPRPEDFEVQQDPAEVRAGDDELTVRDGPLPHDLASPLDHARGGLTRSIEAPQRAR